MCRFGRTTAAFTKPSELQFNRPLVLTARRYTLISDERQPSAPRTTLLQVTVAFKEGNFGGAATRVRQRP